MRRRGRYDEFQIPVVAFTEIRFIRLFPSRCAFNRFVLCCCGSSSTNVCVQIAGDSFAESHRQFRGHGASCSQGNVRHSRGQLHSRMLYHWIFIALHRLQWVHNSAVRYRFRRHLDQPIHDPSLRLLGVALDRRSLIGRLPASRTWRSKAAPHPVKPNTTHLPLKLHRPSSGASRRLPLRVVVPSIALVMFEVTPHPRRRAPPGQPTMPLQASLAIR